jgi:hypothetical protein
LLTKFSGNLTVRIVQFEPQHDNLDIELNPVDTKDTFFQQEENVVWDDLSKLPQWQLVLLTVFSVAYEAYCLCKKQRTSLDPDPIGAFGLALESRMECLSFRP